MTSITQTLTSRLERLFEDRRHAGHAASGKAYMRGQFDFYGIQAPGQREIWRSALDGLSPPTERELAAVARSCWKRREREWQYFGCHYTRTHVGVASADFLGTAEHLIATKSWWDTVDSLAMHTVGPLVLSHGLGSRMDEWIDSPNIWIARTAILHQIRYRADTDTDRLFGYCLRRAGDREFFIRKAIGWALREYTKTDEESVRSFVEANERTLSGLSRTEALKWLERRRVRSRSSPAAR